MYLVCIVTSDVHFSFTAASRNAPNLDTDFNICSGVKNYIIIPCVGEGQKLLYRECFGRFGEVNAKFVCYQRLEEGSLCLFTSYYFIGFDFGAPVFRQLYTDIDHLKAIY